MRSFLSALLALPLVAHAETALSPAASATAVQALEQWLKTPTEQRPPVIDTAFGRVPLTKADADRAVQLLWNDRVAWLKSTRAAELTAKSIRIGDHELKFDTVSFGSSQPPAGGRSLFISLHGGGGGPAAMNDGQWKNQVKLAKNYRPAEGIYVAPRAPTNQWNLWHEAHIDGLFDRLIQDFVAVENVNPNRVFLLGYSAGGDGVYQLAPRMSDRWAAASMMAGHPNETKPVGLRNVPFSLQVGANDHAYQRNKIGQEWGEKLDALQKADPKGYVHFTEIHAGKGHWMDGNDRKAIPWMEKFTRNPLPDRIVWRQDDVTHPSFYWLSVPLEHARAGQEIIAERQGRNFNLQSADIGKVVIRLNDQMADLDQALTVQIGGKPVFNGTVQRQISTLVRTLAERGDRDLMFSAELTVFPPQK